MRRIASKNVGKRARTSPAAKAARRACAGGTKASIAVRQDSDDYR